MYFAAAFGVLLLTGVLKLLASQSELAYLQEANSVFPHLTNKLVYVLAGILEIGSAFWILFSPKATSRAAVLLWVGSLLIIYRVGLHLTGATEPCSCLGGAIDGIKVSTVVINRWLKGFLAYCVIGSMYFLIFHYQKRTRTPRSGVANSTALAQVSDN